MLLSLLPVTSSAHGISWRACIHTSRFNTIKNCLRQENEYEKTRIQRKQVINSHYYINNNDTARLDYTTGTINRLAINQVVGKNWVKKANMVVDPTQSEVQTTIAPFPALILAWPLQQFQNSLGYSRTPSLTSASIQARIMLVVTESPIKTKTWHTKQELCRV